ncbi:chaperonin 10-like protein [Radiomyces spectabilis]|uniref:chaperonin 10-like protein n=1 Tax=Radiomyces spectabilis TaxID=64574 RepID=UPI00221F0C21|nr:chaperonin 10-like protein [Radiomyces spectabilis]KAI8377949.1 chaperonin 10-like protein [Radiomyces spectabilis]
MGYKIKAFATTDQPGKFKETSYDVPSLGENEVYIKMIACGICHTDCLYMEQPDSILGHEPVGEITEVGSNVTKLKKGDIVGFSYLQSACLDCEQCDSGNDIMCPKRVMFPERNNNAFAEGAVRDAKFVYKIPKELKPEHAAPLMCAGLTVFTAIYNSKIKPTDRVAVVGIGGLGHLAIQFARAWGCHVTAISHSADKKDECMKFGAHDYLCSKDFNDDYINKCEKFDYILNTVSANLPWDDYMHLLKPNGTFCLIGIPSGSVEIKDVFTLLNQQRGVRGCVLGGRHVITKMLDFAAQHNIKPQIEEYGFNLEGLEKGIDRCKTSKARYRAVLVAGK